jgi:hypothetical protein
MPGFWVTKAVGTALRVGFNIAGLADAALDRAFHQRHNFALWKDWQVRSLPPQHLPALPRPEILQKYPFTQYDTTGYYTLTMIAALRPRKLVAATLPPELELCPCELQSDVHPVFYTLGFQQNVLPIRGQFPLNYLEVIVGIPCVRLRDAGTGYASPFIYMPALYLDHVYPILLGKAIGYPKHWARMSTTYNSIDVRNLVSHERILNGTFNPIANIGTMQDYPLADKVISRLQQPLISSVFGLHVYTFLDWRFRYSKMQAVEATVTTSIDVPTLPRGTYKWNGVESDESWACRVFVPWDIVFPFSRSVLNPTLPCPDKQCSLSSGTVT